MNIDSQCIYGKLAKDLILRLLKAKAHMMLKTIFVLDLLAIDASPLKCLIYYHQATKSHISQGIWLLVNLVTKQLSNGL